MGMKTKTLKVLDNLSERGLTQISLLKLKVEFINQTNIGRGEFKAYARYMIDSGLIQNTGGEFYQINHELRLNLKEEQPCPK